MLFKILGKLMYNEPYLHLLEKNYIFCEQFHFGADRLTDHTIIEIIDEITNGFMENKNTVGVYKYQ